MDEGESRSAQFLSADDRPVMLTLAAGRLYLRTGKVRADQDEFDAAVTILGHVLGPGGAPCVALAAEPVNTWHLAETLAAVAARLPADHPHAPWGVLVTRATSERDVQAVRDQVADMSGDVVVCYEAGRGDRQGADLVRHVCQEHGAGFVLIASPARWQGMVLDELHESFPRGSVVVRFPEPSPETVLRALTYHAQQLSTFHGLPVPPDVVQAAAAHTDDALPDARMRTLPGQELDPVTLGITRLNHWATRQLVAPAVDVHAVARGLAEQLRVAVIGQDDVVNALARHVAVGAGGLRMRTDRPRTAVLLTGPTGTGKTLLATTLAEVLRVQLIRVDLAAFTDPHRISSLLGSPPGYVGSNDDGNWLTKRIADAPNAVLLLDEFEKSSPQLWGPLLLEMLGAGTLTDETGRTVSCRGLHVILTANIGARDLTRGPTGFGQSTVDDRVAAAVGAVRRLLPDEVFNRLDDVLVLRPVGGAAAAQILRSALGLLLDRLAGLGYHVRVSPGAQAVLLAHAAHESDGVRRMHRTLERLVLTPVLDLPAGTYQVVRAKDSVQVRTANRPSRTTR
jgi:ATP-dependent Clp protease ATP-binding subunit ClpA